jgi:hypothetical protein
MSWNAYLSCECCGSQIVSNGYTHNTNGMANLALDPDYKQQPVAVEVFFSKRLSWWQQLDGMTGPEGAAFLNRIIVAFDTEPDKYRPLNPKNGWGDLDEFRALLIELRDSVPEYLTRWTVNG